MHGAKWCVLLIWYSRILFNWNKTLLFCHSSWYSSNCNNRQNYANWLVSPPVAPKSKTEKSESFFLLFQTEFLVTFSWDILAWSLAALYYSYSLEKQAAKMDELSSPVVIDNDTVSSGHSDPTMSFSLPNEDTQSYSFDMTPSVSYASPSNPVGDLNDR